MTTVLSGPIPGELGSIYDLQWLSLYGNDLTGEIPPELAKLGSASKLERLFLQDNDLSEEIPEELGSLTSLTHLLLRGNNLGGEIPHELGNLPNLKWLYLSGNTFKGCIPERLRVLELHDLDDLDISFCDFDALAAIYDSAGGTSWQNNDNWMSDRPFSDWYGVTTDEIGRVTGLDLRSNELSGEIPTELEQSLQAGVAGAPTQRIDRGDTDRTGQPRQLESVGPTYKRVDRGDT